VSVDLPVIGEVVAASPSKPYLCLKLTLDCTQLSDLLLGARLPALTETQPDLGLAVHTLSPEMLDVAVRLIGLLDRPSAIPTLAPLYERELLYFLLAGPHAGRLRQIARAEGRTAQITKAVRWITTRFREPISVEDAAAEAGMSASSFHEHFKAVTAHSPLQYQKLLRLQGRGGCWFRRGSRRPARPSPSATRARSSSAASTPACSALRPSAMPLGSGGGPPACRPTYLRV
jgi:hypothetical protein